MNAQLPRTPESKPATSLMSAKPEPQREPFLIGALGGLLSGLLGAYFFTRAAHELPEDQRQPIKTAQMFGVALAILTLMRQIAELNKPAKPEKRGWRG